MTPISSHIEAFLRVHLPRDRGASVHTCESYADTFRLLFEFASQRLELRPSEMSLEQLDAHLIIAFLTHLETERGNSVRTRNVRLTAIKAFFRFLEYRLPSILDQLRRIFAIPTKRTDERLVAYLNSDEMQAILDAPDPTTQSGIRDRAILHLTFNAGLRASELVAIRLDDLAFQPQATIQILGKGRRERALPLWKETTQALRDWLAIRPNVSASEIFLNARGAPLTRWGLGYLLKKHAAAAALLCASLTKKRISPHTLRHTCAMHFLKATQDIRKVSLWLGHASIQTTETFYTRADPTEKLEALAATAPPNLRQGRFRSPDKLIAMLKSGLSSPRLCAATDPEFQARTQEATANST